MSTLISFIFILLLIYLGRDLSRYSRKKSTPILYLAVFCLSIVFGSMLTLTLHLLHPSSFNVAQPIVNSAGFALAFWVIAAPFQVKANNIKPIQSNLKEELSKLLAKARLQRDRISLESFGDLNMHNAYVKLEFKPPFKFKYKIRLSDGIVRSEDYSSEEKSMILAHEIGHIKTLPRYILLTFLTLFTLFTISHLILSYAIAQLFNAGFTSIEILMMINIPLALFFIAIYSMLKRRVELQADKEALKYGGDARALISALHKIYSKDKETQINNPLINLIFKDQPPLEKRIKNIQGINI